MCRPSWSAQVGKDSRSLELLQPSPRTCRLSVQHPGVALGTLYAICAQCTVQRCAAGALRMLMCELD